MSCSSAPTLKRNQKIYSVFFIYKASMRPHGTDISFFLSLPPLVAFQWFGLPKILSTQTRTSLSKMYEFLATAVRYRKRNTTLKCRSRLKKYQTKILTTIILTVASQHGLSLPVSVSLPFFNCDFMILKYFFPPSLRPCVIHARRKYFSQLVSNVIFLFFIVPIRRQQKSLAFTLIFCASSDFILYF